MRIAGLKRIALALGLLGFGTFLSALVAPQQFPAQFREVSLLMGLLAAAVAIGLEVFVVIALRRRRILRNRQWLDSFQRRSQTRKADSRKHKTPSPSPKPPEAD